MNDSPSSLPRAAYPAWTCSYSNEAFDRAQGLAAELTQEDRAAGRPAPAYGYSLERFAEAAKIVDAANRYSEAFSQRARS